jgi:hypothetical protein
MSPISVGIGPVSCVSALWIGHKSEEEESKYPIWKVYTMKCVEDFVRQLLMFGPAKSRTVQF